MDDFVIDELPNNIDNPNSSVELDNSQSSSFISNISQDITLQSPDHLNSKQTKITDEYFPKQINKKRHELVSNSIANFIAKDMMPISIVEGEGFIEMMSTIVPGYNVPSRTAIKKRIETLYELEQRRINKIIDNLSYVSLTTDCWTSRSIESYYTVTVHGIDSNWNIKSLVLCTSVMNERHTGENLKTKITETLNSWNIMNKTISISHDNAANIICAMRLLNSESRKEHIESVRCFAHTMQCSLNCGLQVDV